MSLRKPRIAAGLAGASLLASLAAARAVASASDAAVFLAGHEVHWSCVFKQAFGIPCPTCGLTRSFLLALHGQARAAMSINPGGPLLFLGAVLMSAVMFYLAFQQGPFKTARQRTLTGASVYGGLLIAVLLAHWVFVLV